MKLKVARWSAGLTSMNPRSGRPNVNERLIYKKNRILKSSKTAS